MRSLLLVAAIATSVPGLPAQSLQPRPPAVGDTEPTSRLSLPSGTKLMVRLDRQLDPQNAILGQDWTGTLVNDIPVGNRVALKRDTPVDGIVVAVKSGRLRTSGSISLQIFRVNNAATLTDVLTRGKDGHWKSGAKIGGGTALGAAIGGLTGGVPGAVVGGAVGAATGTVAAATSSGNKQPAVPTEDVLTFTVQ